MISTLKISAAQVILCHDIMKYFAAKAKDTKDVTDEVKTRWDKGLFRRIELREAHQKLRNHSACPYFLTKNTMAKASQKEGNGLYNVQKFIDHAAKHPPAEKPAAEEKPAAKKAPKAKKTEKKEAKAKKGKGKKEAPAETPAAAEPVAETPVENAPTDQAE